MLQPIDVQSLIPTPRRRGRTTARCVVRLIEPIDMGADVASLRRKQAIAMIGSALAGLMIAAYDEDAPEAAAA